MLEHLAKHPKNKLFKKLINLFPVILQSERQVLQDLQNHTSTCIWDPANIENYKKKKEEKLIIVNRKFNPQSIKHVLLHWTSLCSQEWKVFMGISSTHEILR